MKLCPFFNHRGPRFKFAWLSFPDNVQWCTEVMNVERFGEISPGTVLALNGHRKYLSIFKPTDLTKGEFFRSQDGGLMGFNESDSETETETQDGFTEYERKRQKVLSVSLRREFPLWFGKLSDGLVNREKVDDWPKLDA